LNATIPFVEAIKLIMSSFRFLFSLTVIHTAFGAAGCETHRPLLYFLGRKMVISREMFEREFFVEMSCVRKFVWIVF
jgi:hypothetical protein